MRTKHQSKRLLKLIEFLEKLPRKKFFFGSEVSECKSNGHVCPTVACAIGWTPELFPRIVKNIFEEAMGDDGLGIDGLWQWAGFEIKGEYAHIDTVSRHLFGENSKNLFWPDYQKEVNSRLPSCNDDATPKQVAKMLRQYMKLVP